MWGDNVEMSPFMTLTEDSILIVIFEASTESLTCESYPALFTV